MKIKTNLTQTIKAKTFNVYMSQGGRRKTYYVKIGNQFIITSKKDCNQ